MGEAKSLKLPPCKKSCNRCGRSQGSEVYVPSLSCHMYNCLCTGLPFGPPAKCQSKLNKKTLSKQWSKLLSGQSSARACQTASPQLLRKRIFRSQKSPQVSQNFWGLPFSRQASESSDAAPSVRLFFPQKKLYFKKSAMCVCHIRQQRIAEIQKFTFFQHLSAFFFPWNLFFSLPLPWWRRLQVGGYGPSNGIHSVKTHTHTHTHTRSFTQIMANN